MNSEFWKNKTVLLTGHTGFKGTWLSIWLHKMGAKVVGLSLDPYSQMDNFVLSNLSNKIVDIRADIRDKDALKNVFEKYQPDIVFHLAAQPLVRLSYKEPILTYETNVLGTLNVLECIRYSKSANVGIMITTDKCYENKEQIWGYRESDSFGGYDPYSSSKACAEILISSYRNSYFNIKHYDTHHKAIASVRAGNVIGGGDWAEDRIIPDCIKAIQNNELIHIRNPKATRPWQYVLEPLSGYLLLAEKMSENPELYSGGWNFGPDYESVCSVWEIAENIIKIYGKGNLIDDSSSNNPHEANLLYLDTTKAKKMLNWHPQYNIKQTLDKTVEWYLKYKTDDVYELCIQQIKEYEDMMMSSYGG